MSNVTNLIKKNNSKILSNNKDKIQLPCNCRMKDSCPLNCKCLHQWTVYKPKVTTNTRYKEYYGMLQGVFKSRCNNHKQSFTHISHINDTELSNYLWMFKANRTDYHLKWSIESYASQCKCGKRTCELCPTKKMIIALADWNVLVNKRTELISKCCHIYFEQSQIKIIWIDMVIINNTFKMLIAM